MMLFYDQKLITYFQATSFSQEAVECFKEIETKMVVVLHYVNKTMPGNLLNTYDSKEGLEIIVFEFIISNKKWLLLRNNKPPSQNELFFKMR